MIRNFSFPLRGLLRSLRFFSYALFVPRKVDVIFSYPATFNRNIDKENELILPFLQICKENNLTYLVFEESDLGGAFSEELFSSEAIPLTLISLIEAVYRKFYILISFNRDASKKIDKKINTALSRLFFRRVSANTVITMICHKVGLWRACFPDSQIYDYQHGIIFDGDWGYLLDGQPPSFRIENQVQTLTYGPIISNILISKDQTQFYNQSTVFAIGVEKYKSPAYPCSENRPMKILFSMQDTLDGSHEDLVTYNNKVKRFLDDTSHFFLKNNIELTARHHPRFILGKGINFLDNYSFIRQSNQRVSLQSELAEHHIHLTFNSSSSVEAAYLGMPTIFLELDSPINGDFPHLSSSYVFFDQLQYPLKEFITHNKSEFLALMSSLVSKGWSEHSSAILRWKDLLHINFDKTLALKILNPVQEELRSEKNHLS